MIDDLVESMEDLLKLSRDLYLKNRGPKSKNWEMCFLLYDEGWRSEKVEYVENSTDIIIHWNKNNKNQTIRLTLEEQYGWVKELEERTKNGKK